jgi:hypothetical protein
MNLFRLKWGDHTNQGLNGSASLLVPLVLACFGISPTAQAVSPPPDGGYPGGNTAEGQAALVGLTTGGFNTAVGFLSLRSNSTNSFNTAIGAGALLANTADENTAVGAAALLLNTTGLENTAIGTEALFHNTIGNDNTASGFRALSSNTTGDHNTAIGFGGLLNNTNGADNTATGLFALANSTTGNGNVAVGSGAGMFIVDGNNNVAIGQMAGTTFVHAINSIAIGAPGAGNFADLGNTCFIGSIHGEGVSDVGSAQAVFVDQFNVVGIVPSSRRFKHDVQPMDKASEALLALKPVTFKYNIDKKGTAQFGLIAEEVAEVNPDLVSRDKEGEITTVRYEQINAMLLNEFLKEHRKVEQMQKQIDALTAVVQKVSAQLELSKAAPQTVLNNQ